MDNEDLLKKLVAIHSSPSHSVERSPKGVCCLMCLQEHYPDVWQQMDNGTFYCKKHKLEIVGDFNEQIKRGKVL